MLAFGLCTIKDILEQDNFQASAFYFEYSIVETSEDFDTLVRMTLGEENIGIFQIKNIEGEVTHSSFVFKTSKKIYVAGKMGLSGIVAVDDSEFGMPAILEAFGHLVGVEKFSILFEKYGKKYN